MHHSFRYLVYTPFGSFVAEDYVANTTVRNAYSVDTHTRKVTGEGHTNLHLNGNFLVADLSEKDRDAYKKANPPPASTPTPAVTHLGYTRPHPNERT